MANNIFNFNLLLITFSSDPGMHVTQSTNIVFIIIFYCKDIYSIVLKIYIQVYVLKGILVC